MADINWEAIFVPQVPLLEIFIRGTVTYIGVFVLLRYVLKRQSRTSSFNDILVVVLLADAAQNAMAGGYTSVTDGLLLVAVIIFWTYLLDWLGYRFQFVQRFILPPALLLVKDGELQRQNMRQELLTRDELMSLLREQGVEDLAQVRKAYMESDGKLAVIKKESGRP